MPKKKPHKRGQNRLSKHIGKQLSRAREFKEVSLRELGNMSGVSVSGILTIEQGKASPTMDTLYRLSSSLELPLEYWTEGFRVNGQ